jgi:uncharacterized protein YkwD
MFPHRPSRVSRRALLVAAAGLAAAACSGERPPAQPTFYDSMARPGATLDAATAASMISGYRSNNGLSAVTVDPDLMRIAEAQAKIMAARDRTDQRIDGTLAQRLKRAGYASGVAAENVSAGYHTLAEAFSGWRDSPPHRANMLLNGATRIGIAAVYAPGSKYRVFWSLILAGPAPART